MSSASIGCPCAYNKPDMKTCSLLRSGISAAQSMRSCLGCSARWKGGRFCHVAAPDASSLSPQPPQHMAGHCTLMALEVHWGQSGPHLQAMSNPFGWCRPC